MNNQNVVEQVDKKRLISNFLSLFVLRGFQFIIPLLALPYLVRTVGLDKFGLISFAQSLAIYFGAIIQYGFNVTATREIARNRDDRYRVEHIYSHTLFASVLLSIGSIVILLTLSTLFGSIREHLDLYMYAVMFAVFQSLFPVWFFQGIERMKYITFLSLGASIVYLLGLLVFVKGEGDFVLVPLLNAVAALLVLIASLFVIRRNFGIKLSIPSFEGLKSTYKEGFDSFISQFTPNLYNNSTVFLLGIFTSDAIVGIYSAATKVIDAVNSLGYILSNTFLPYLSRNINRHSLFKNIMLVSGAILSVVVFCLSEDITSILLGENNSAVSRYIGLLSVSIFLVFSILTYGANYLMLVGQGKTVRNISLITSLLFFLLALILIPQWGITGSMIVLIGGRLAIAVFQYIFYLIYK